MKVGIFGCGHVGLVTAACLAELGHIVVATDDDPQKLAALEAGRVPFFEPQLDALVARNVAYGRLRFTPDPAAVCEHGELLFICVGTPPRDTGDADLSAITRVAQIIARYSRGHKVVVEKSTVPVQTGQRLQQDFLRANTQAEFDVVSNPEFQREGTAVSDFLHPQRIVVGVSSQRAAERMRELYRPILDGSFNCTLHADCPLRQSELRPQWIETDINTAEIIKHASNSFLALKLSYINAVADLCERFGVDVKQVAEALGLDPRIGRDYLRAGLGFGGFCLPKDIQAFRRLAEKVGYDFAFLREAERINQERVPRFLAKLTRALGSPQGKTITLLGLAFKPNTDDIRFAPALEILQRLQEAGAQVKAYDPQAMEKTQVLFPQVVYCRDAYEAAAGSEALLLVTEWEEFSRLDWQRIRQVMARPLVLDGRNLLDPKRMRQLGFQYLSMGRPD